MRHFHVLGVSGDQYRKENGRWGFFFEAGEVCTNPDCGLQKKTYRSKVDYGTEDEAKAALKRSVEHFVQRMLVSAKASGVEVLNMGRAPVEVDPFVGSGPEVH